MRKELEININSLELKIAKASKTVSKNLSDIFLIAVSKKKNIEHIRKAQNLGINNFGENYAQELEEKANGFLTKTRDYTAQALTLRKERNSVYDQYTKSRLALKELKEQPEN